MNAKLTIDKVFISIVFILLIIINLNNARIPNDNTTIIANKSTKCFMETEADTEEPFNQVKFEKNTDEWFNCMENMFARIKEQRK
jgi:hypothetical protein